MAAESDPIISASQAQADSSSASVVCGMCRRQFSKYTCPVCNIPYCSLTCFRNEAHNQCSEGFYKKQVESDIRGAPSANEEERRRMMDVLKRFEEDAAAEDEDREDDSDPEDELAARLEGVDLDAMPTDELWELLSPEQRARFMEAVNNPEGEMAKTLLASEEVARDMRPPWWETHAHGEPATSQDTTPLPVRIPTRMIKPLPEEQVSLVYNYVAICLAYTYTVRHLALPSIAQVADDDALEAKRLLRTLVPFLFDRRSRTIFAGLQEAVTDVWSRMNETIPSAPLFAVLLKDVAVLLKPLLVVASFNGGSDVPSADAETVDPTTLPQATPIIVLSDLTELFENPQGEATTPLTPAGHKLLFYAAHLASTPPPVLQLVADEAKTRASLFEREAQETAVSRAGGRPPTTRHTPIIEELP